MKKRGFEPVVFGYDLPKDDKNDDGLLPVIVALLGARWPPLFSSTPSA